MSTVRLLVTLVIVLTINSCASLPQDKQKHFTAGFAISLGGGKDYGLILGCGAGVAKELYDETAELADFVYTCAGSGLANWLWRRK